MSAVVQNHVRLAGFAATDFHVMPTKLRPDTGAKSFCDGFLCRKSRGDILRGVLKCGAVGDFTRAQNALDERIAESFERRFDAGNFGDVRADAETHAGGIVREQP